MSLKRILGCSVCVWALASSSMVWSQSGDAAAQMVQADEAAAERNAMAARRNQLQSPGLQIISDVPIAPQNVLQFHADRLYTAGEDHVVRSYEIVDGRADVSSVRLYRWPAWREERGEIRAMAFSPDGRRMAIAGVDLAGGRVYEFDLASGEISRVGDDLLDSLSAVHYDREGTLWVGTDGGQVATLNSDGMFQLLESERPRASDLAIVLIATRGEEIVALDRRGNLRRFLRGRPIAPPVAIAGVNGLIRDAAVDDNGNVLMIDGMPNQPLLLTRQNKIGRMEGSETRHYRSVCYDVARRKFLASGQQFTPQRSGTFRAHLVLDEVDWSVGEGWVRATPLFESTLQGIPRALAVSPRVAVISDGETGRLWFFHPVQAGGQPSDEISQGIGGGRGIERLVWTEENQLWYAKQRGDGEAAELAIEGFDLPQRRLLEFDERTSPALTPPPQEANGFSVVQDLLGMPRQIVPPEGAAVDLQLDSTDGRVSTMGLWPSSDGRVLAILGHRWGATALEIGRDGRVMWRRKLIGVQGRVTAVALSPDGQFVLCGGSDGTAAMFSLLPWSFHREWGGRAALVGGELQITDVADGSPAWEMGLVGGDRVSFVGYRGQDVTDPAAMAEILRSPSAGALLQVRVSRDGETEFLDLQTRTIQRPLWKLYVDNGEWILWRWRDYFYDCSVEGDSLVGWQVNRSLTQTPTPIAAEQARERFHRPSKLTDLLNLVAMQPEQAAAPEILVPRVNLEVGRQGEHIAATVSLSAEENSLLTEDMAELSIWVGDYRITRWERPSVPFEQRIEIDANLLRSGDNILVARGNTRDRVRGDSRRFVIHRDSPTQERTLWGVAVGISDYKYASEQSQQRSGLELRDLPYPVNDAREMAKLMRSQTHFDNIRVVELIDDRADHLTIYKALAQVAASAQPDDCLLLSLAGHGYCWPDGEDYDPNSFVFITYDAQVATGPQESSAVLPMKPRSGSGSGLEINSLFDALAAIPCRKILLFDACHSGGASEVIRSLTPDLQVGPTVLTAAQRDQTAQESPYKVHGLFTYAILEASERRGQQADENQDRFLSPEEIHRYAATRVPELLEESKIFFTPEVVAAGQDPGFWAPESDAQRPLLRIK